MKKYGILVGSLRKNSNSEAIAKAIIQGLPRESEVTYFDINLPLYNQDFDGSDLEPESYTAFREAVAAQDAFIIVTPEYNRSFPGVLKNALDIASRPWGENVWEGKPVVVASSSVSALSGALANNALRQTLQFLNMPVLTQPEVYIANAGELIEDGEVTAESTKDFLAGVGQAFADFVASH